MKQADTNDLNFKDASELANQLADNISKVILGQKDLITETLCTFLSSGHILMTGAPGLAKTTLVRVFSQQLNLKFGRVQFTPDLLPSDIIGSEILNINPENSLREFKFTKGPIFVNLLLADEINRSSPRTQSAMLEAMQEHQVTIAGKVYELPSPFMVFATQNPFESEGTFPLPEAQLDRFLMHSYVEYPEEEAEKNILEQHAKNHLIGSGGFAEISPSLQLTEEQIHSLIATTKQVHVHDEMISIVTQLIRSTRPNSKDCPEDIKPSIWFGAGPRAGISLISASRSLALLEGEENVRWRHIKRVAKPVLRHRIKLAAQTGSEQQRVDELIDKLIDKLVEQHNHLLKG